MALSSCPFTCRSSRLVPIAPASEEPEAHPTHRAEQRLTRRAGQLPAQIPHVDVHHVAFRIKVHVPHLLEESRTANHLPGMEQEMLEELELLGRELQRAVGNRHEV